MDIFYLGPGGSFSEKATQTFFPHENFIPSPSIEDVLEHVKKHPTAYGVVPVENSLEGTVIRTLDLILEHSLHVSAELSLPIVQNLLSHEQNLPAITAVYSHPHALAQVRPWIQKNLPHAEVKEVNSTSLGAEIAAKTPHAAAIASQNASVLYHLPIQAKSINSHKNNITRFWVVGAKKDAPCFPTSLPTKTNVYVIVKDKVGALRDLLDTFSQNHISLTAIQSRPLESEPWKYGFFIDLLVDAHDPLAKKMFSRLSKTHPVVNIIGTYPQSGAFNQKTTLAYNLKRIETIFKKNSAGTVLKKCIYQTFRTLSKATNPSPEMKKIWYTRLLIIPSVALYKNRHHKDITDTKRDTELLKKMNVHQPLYTLYATLLKHSKTLQKECMALMQSKTVRAHDILSFPLADLRYYIDYLDSFALSLWRDK